MSLAHHKHSRTVAARRPPRKPVSDLSLANDVTAIRVQPESEAIARQLLAGELESGLVTFDQAGAVGAPHTYEVVAT